MGEGVQVEMVIVGGGMSGICMAIKLLQAGHKSFVLVEKQSDLGGTWNLNAYPGCSCDVPSHLYSFSFLPNPTWSCIYAPRAEIHHYVTRSARLHGLLPYTRLNTEALSATWDESASLWHVDVKSLIGSSSSSSSSSSFSSYTISARFLIRAVGGLHEPMYPTIPGIHCFAGRSFHSSLWDSSIDLHDKKVAVIGTGASAIQIVPAIAPIVKELYVLQRTPAWILPKNDGVIPKIWRRIFEKAPVMMALWRGLLFLTQEMMVWAFLGGKAMRRVGEWAAKRHMHKTIKDPDMRAMLTPKYEIGCKRILLSSSFYPALARPNVKLVTQHIHEIQEHGLLLRAGSHGENLRSIDLDIIIYATGFYPLHPRFPVLGASGLPLSQASFSSFLGTTKHGFSNFFMLLGPNTGLGHTSQLVIIEAQVRYILSCLRLVTPPTTSSLELRYSSESRYQEVLARRFPNTVWSSGGCTSWYLDPKTCHNPIIWPGSTIEYIWRSWSANPLDYQLR